MKRNILLTAVALAFGMSATAQMEDVTSKYITNPGFEDCEAMANAVDAENNTLDYVDLYNNKGGQDYADKGWSRVEENLNANAAVVAYGGNVGYTGWGTTVYSAPLPTEGPEGTTGNKTLCMTGSSSAMKYQTAEVELPAGLYRLVVHTNFYSGWQTETGATSYSGFVATEGNSTFSTKATFKCNAWDEDVVEIEVPVAMKGRFQIGYTAGFFMCVDDVQLFYEDKVITSSLEAVIAKAEAISKALYDSDESLTKAIADAKAFVENPTSQADVATQEQLLWNAVKTALEQTFEPVDITGGYIENASFENGNIGGWTSAFAAAATASPYQQPQPRLDGSFYAYFAWNATEFSIEQTVSNLPEGYYMLQAIGNTAPFILYVNDAEGTLTPSTGLFDMGFSAVTNITDGQATIGAKSKDSFSVDDFRLIYCTDEEQLADYQFDAVAEAAKAMLNDENYAIVTGEERDALADAIDATEGTVAERIAAIQQAMATFAAAKTSYQTFETAKTNASAYTLEVYPYADPAIYQNIVDLKETVATSAENAEELAQRLNAACQALADSHYRMDGVTDKEDYTAKLGAWTLSMIEADADREGYYKQTDEFYNAGNATGSMEQTIAGLPAGKYVFVCNSRAAFYTTPTIYIDGEAVAELPHTGMTNYVSGVGYVDSWTKGIYAFDKVNGKDMNLKVEFVHNTNYPTYYRAELGIGDIVIYRIDDAETVYGVVGDFSEWEKDLMLTKAEEDGTYKLTIENMEVKELKTYEYKVRANKEWGGYELPAAGSNPQNLSWTPENYGVYNLTFTFDLEANTCTLDAERIDDITWICVYWNVEGWNEVWAYTWNSKGEQVGSWPGTQLSGSGNIVDGAEMFMFLYKGDKPDYIIFNNGQSGDDNQTFDLEFVDRKEYRDGSKTTATGIAAPSVLTGTEAVYDLQGRRIEGTPKSGVYVKNGKKFFVK